LIVSVHAVSTFVSKHHLICEHRKTRTFQTSVTSGAPYPQLELIFIAMNVEFIEYILCLLSYIIDQLHNLNVFQCILCLKMINAFYCSVPEVRRNRWGNEEENATSISRPIKQEPNSGEEGEYVWGRKPAASKEENILSGQKDKPNFGLSGKLAEDTNTFNGVVIKYSQPPEARKPKRRWRFYPFKGDKGLPTLYIHRQSSYLIGRDRKVADIPVDHPSCSKQHAALQYRLVPFEREDGTIGKRVRPYIIDLESSNGTYVNNVKIDPRTYVELLEKDVIKFGYSSREYVLLHEQSKDEELDDDVATGGND